VVVVVLEGLALLCFARSLPASMLALLDPRFGQDCVCTCSWPNTGLAYPWASFVHFRYLYEVPSRGLVWPGLVGLPNLALCCAVLCCALT
jgi:hypothetical protein